jgi:hypothetical protein
MENRETLRHVYFRPLIPLLVSYAAGICLARTTPAVLFPAEVLLTALSIFCVIRRAAARQPSSIWPLLLFLGLGFLSLSPWHIAPLDADHVTRQIGETSWHITGRVAEEPILQGYRVKLRLSDVEIKPPVEPPI